MIDTTNTQAFGTPLNYTTDLPPFSGLKTEEVILGLIIGGLVLYAASEYYKAECRKYYQVKIVKGSKK